MLLQALRVEIEMKNLHLQVAFLVQKGVGTRSHPTTPLGLGSGDLSHKVSIKTGKTCRAYDVTHREPQNQNETKFF